MKITIMSRLFWPRQFGGLEHVLWQLSNALVDLGTDLTVLSEMADGIAETQEARPGLRILRHDPVEIGRLWRIGELLQIRRWQQALRDVPATGWLIANEPTAAVAAIRAGRARHLMYRPIFCYDAIHHLSQSEPAMHAFRRTRMSRRLDRYAYRRAACVIDESDNLREQHRAWYGDRPRLHVIRNGTAPPQYAPAQRHAFGLSDKDFVVGFVGRPGDPCKDMPFLLEALQARPLPERFRLLIVGGGDGLANAKQWVQNAGLEACTRWAGALDDTGPAYRAMDVMVLPSRYETFGNVIREAHGHGVPVIARRRDTRDDPAIYTASDELIDHGRTGLTVAPRDPDDLADALHYMLANPTERATIGARAAALMKHNTWHDTARDYLGLLTRPTLKRSAIPAIAA